MSTKVSTYTVGSWFPTGYYGHYRNRVRMDFVNEYRQLAKPQPPERFLQRSAQPATSHVFSLHDNKQNITESSYYAPENIGKKRHPQFSDTLDSSFISWPQYRSNPNIGRPLTSTYRKDFRMGEPNVQKLIKRPTTSFDNPLTTTYRSTHGYDSPNRQLINAMNNDTLVSSTRSRLSNFRLKKRSDRDTVASCMSWYRPCVPEATCITTYCGDGRSTTQDTNNCSVVSDTMSANQGQTTVSEIAVPVPAPTE